MKIWCIFLQCWDKLHHWVDLLTQRGICSDIKVFLLTKCLISDFEVCNYLSGHMSNLNWIGFKLFWGFCVGKISFNDEKTLSIDILNLKWKYLSFDGNRHSFEGFLYVTSWKAFPSEKAKAIKDSITTTISRRIFNKQLSLIFITIKDDWAHLLKLNLEVFD